MENNTSNLIEVIEQEAEILEALSDILYRQKNAAIKGDLALLNELTEAQVLAYSKLNELEQERLRLVAPIAEELELPPQEITLALLKKHCEASERSRWERMHQLLKPLANRVKHTLKVNGMFFSKCAELGEERLKQILEFRNQQNLYNVNGKKTKDGKKSGVLVNKQI